MKLNPVVATFLLNDLLINYNFADVHNSFILADGVSFSNNCAILGVSLNGWLLSPSRGIYVNVPYALSTRYFRPPNYTAERPVESPPVMAAAMDESMKNPSHYSPASPLWPLLCRPLSGSSIVPVNTQGRV